MKKMRIPLPRQTEKVFRSAKDYKRDNKIRSIEWEIDCPNCGTLIQVQKSDPVLCPQCKSPDIETNIKE